MQLSTAKSITKFVVGSSTAFTTSRVIRNNMTTDSNLQKAESVVGGVAIGMMVSEASEAWIDRKFDAMAAWWRENVTQR